MSKRSVGFGFIALAVITFCVKYLSAAIFVSETEMDTLGGMQSILQQSLSTVNSPLNEISLFLVTIGILYLLWSEMENRLQQRKA
ncbi:MAG: hypothetical protein PHO01_10240 [Desulfotomaculaceae bacterium]|nr:hypothetical protein [Desulfotomaculaceae bacterium]